MTKSIKINTIIKNDKANGYRKASSITVFVLSFLKITSKFIKLFKREVVHFFKIIPNFIKMSVRKSDRAACQYIT